MITGLHHINLRAPAALLDTLRDFYRDVLGLTVGPRPDFGSEGYWLYAGGHPIVHLSTQRPHEPQRGPVDPRAPTTFHESRSAVTRQHQFFLQDPAGNGVEINFPFEG
jgi:catechol 2,3-dioxygenase-like lactoylglutathione lyase family enzyme